jgi:hypothetical protein
MTMLAHKSPESTADRNWKRIFLAVEAFIVLACFYGIVMRITHRYDDAWHPHMMTAFRLLEPLLLPMFRCFLVAIFFLTFVSPLFLHSHRSTVTRAWIIGAVGLLFAWLLFTV